MHPIKELYNETCPKALYQWPLTNFKLIPQKLIVKVSHELILFKWSVCMETGLLDHDNYTERRCPTMAVYGTTDYMH